MLPLRVPPGGGHIRGRRAIDGGPGESVRTLMVGGPDSSGTRGMTTGYRENDRQAVVGEKRDILKEVSGA